MAFMDELDAAIVGHLQRDGRQTNRELARAIAPLEPCDPVPEPAKSIARL
jgi:DNA-binding Lrp family transcriptional regulator